MGTSSIATLADLTVSPADLQRAAMNLSRQTARMVRQDV
jgi:hypothetical protein